MYQSFAIHNSTDMLRFYADACAQLSYGNYTLGQPIPADLRNTYRAAYVARRMLEQSGYKKIAASVRDGRRDTFHIAADHKEGDTIWTTCYSGNPRRDDTVALINNWTQPDVPPLSDDMIRSWLGNIIHMATRMLEGKPMDDQDRAIYTAIIQDRIDIAANSDSDSAGEITRNRSHTRVGVSVPYGTETFTHTETIHAPENVSQETTERAVTGLLISIARVARNEYAKQHATEGV